MTGPVQHISFHSLPSVLPIFPLEGAILLPRARLPLNIFEPRYLAMIDECLRSPHRMIGMVQPLSKTSDAIPPRLHRVGCAGRLVSFNETEDGRYLIALGGCIRFEIGAEIDSFLPFRQITPNWAPYRSDLEEQGDVLDEDQRHRFLHQLRAYFDASHLSVDWEALEQADDETIANAISMLCPFSTAEKQALLEASGLAERIRDLRALMAMATAPGDPPSDIQ
ncbi:MAG: LON peptidase substrate-binding domain-containing protein [Neomegalonema sp.]|nr:LON peptidase substrate-binding domain-containing protein [Neomegalonema sp.]